MFVFPKADYNLHLNDVTICINGNRLDIDVDNTMTDLPVEKEDEEAFVPSEIDNDEVRQLLRLMRDKGWLDDNLIPPKKVITNAQAAIMANFVTQRCFLPPKWGIFEKWWGRKGLRQSFNRGETECDYSDFIDALKKLK